MSVAALKVLQIHNRYRERGGEDTVVAREASLLRAAGHTVIEYHVANPTEASADCINPAGGTVESPGGRSVCGRSSRRSDPDVVHVHNTWWALTPSIVGVLDRLNVPTVATLHNYRLVVCQRPAVSRRCTV